MPGGKYAVHSGRELQAKVAEIAGKLALEVKMEVMLGRRLWGAKRKIDLVVKHPETRLSLGIECKHQNVAGTAEEKIPATFADMKAWPIRGILVFSGAGFSRNMESYLISTGMAVSLEDLETWLQLYFGL
jgi:hypothetical protein